MKNDTTHLLNPSHLAPPLLLCPDFYLVNRLFLRSILPSSDNPISTERTCQPGGLCLSGCRPISLGSDTRHDDDPGQQHPR